MTTPTHIKCKRFYSYLKEAEELFKEMFDGEYFETQVTDLATRNYLDDLASRLDSLEEKVEQLTKKL